LQPAQIGLYTSPVNAWCFGLFVAAAPLWAHHSFAAEYDNQKPVTHKGVVTKIDWMNPHVYIYIDEKSEDGKVLNWGFEGYPPNTLRRIGLSREMLKVGDSISVTGWAAKDGSARFAGREIFQTDPARLRWQTRSFRNLAGTGR
jgi:hypothetical protein